MKLPSSILFFLTVLAPLGSAQQPNIVFIISDDAGFADWGFMAPYTSSVNPGQPNSPVPTPNLDTLRSRGVLLTNTYTASVCSPSRAAIVTGSYQNRIGYEFNINNRTAATAAPDGLHPDTITIFDRMKNLGYTTGVVGKWHLGAIPDHGGSPGNRPPRQGVDEFFGIWKGSRNYTVGGVNDSGTLRETILNPNGAITDTVLESTLPWQGMNVTNVFGQGAVDFIDRHYQDSAPFFLYVSFTAPHGPIHSSPDINDARLAGLSGTRKQYASMVLTMDKEIGRILAKLDDPAGDGSVSLTEETLVIFINDNGGASGNGTVNTPLRDWKGSPFEGGTRVPMILAGDGLTASPGTTYHKPTHSIDILPTCVEVGGGTPLEEIDGVNLLPFLNGTNRADPHEFIMLRHEGEMGIRTGNWKLVKNGRGAPFQLYNLEDDLEETTDLAAANPALMAQLLQEITRFEAENDKPRHSKLGQAADTINQNNRFVLAPTPGGDLLPTGPNLIVNPGFESGTQADADLRFTFAELDGWTNDGDAASSEVGAINNDPRAGVYRGVFVRSTRIPSQVTSHFIAGGETMYLDFWHKGKSAWDTADTIEVELFYPNDTGTIPLSNFTVNPQTSAYRNTTHLFPPITDPAAVGKRLGIRFLSNGGASEFVSIDDVFLSTGSASGGLVRLNWSTPDAWRDPGTNNATTLLDLDSFPGCVLEFPTRNEFSYLASNDMTRPTELPFMLNKVILSGSFTGPSPQSATIDGNELLLTRDLAGFPPTIELSANGAGFSYLLAADLLLFDDLDIRGAGTASFTVAGSIRDYLDPRRLTKSGPSQLTLAGTHTYSGPTVVAEGRLLLDSAALSSSLTIAAGASISGTGSTTGTLTVDGTLAISIESPSSNRLEVTGTLDITAAKLQITTGAGALTEPAYVIATYGSRTGTFASVDGLPDGYELHYQFDDGSSSNNLALVQLAETPYESWATSSGRTGLDATFEADPNRDGVPNGIAFLLGAGSPDDNAQPLLPTGLRDDAHFELTFRRADAAASVLPTVEYASDLRTWLPAVDNFNDVEVRVLDDGFGPGIDRITVTLPISLAPDGVLFARLRATPR